MYLEDGEIMILEPLILPINQDIFDDHFMDFLCQEWPQIIVTKHQMSQARTRFELSFKSTTTKPSHVFGEIERISIHSDKIEVNIALVDFESYPPFEFFTEFYTFVNIHWWILPEVYRDFGRLSMPIHMVAIPALFDKYHIDPIATGFSHPRYIGKEQWEKFAIPTGDPQEDKRRQSLLSDLHKRLSPLENQSNTLNSEKAETIVSAQTQIEKRGRSRYTDQQKLEAIQEWDAIDPSTSAITLPEYLEDRFGVGADEILVVPESTFHGWRRQLIKKGLLDS